MLALGGSEEDAAGWRRACVDVMSVGSTSVKSTPAATGIDELDSTADADVNGWGEPAQTVAPLDPVQGFQIVTTKPGTTTVLTVFMLGIFINVFAHVPVDPLGLPIYLDMIGTAIAAIMLGPWIGVAVGLSSSLLTSTVIMDWPGMSFALFNVAGALIWGFGFHHWRMRTPLKFLLLNIMVGLGCTLVAVPVLVFVFGGSSGTSQDTLIPVAELLGKQLWAAVFSSNLLTSVADKLISGVVALGVSWALWRILRHQRVKPKHTDLTQ